MAAGALLNFSTSDRYLFFSVFSLVNFVNLEGVFRDRIPRGLFFLRTRGKVCGPFRIILEKLLPSR